MIKIEHLETCGWEAVIRGMRNPKNSWGRSDSRWKEKEYWGVAESIGTRLHHDDFYYDVGENDADLMKRLRDGGPVHAKYRRMITVYCDITAPLYWWKEYDTYKVGTVANSCSTMHKLGEKEFELEDFSYEHLLSYSNGRTDITYRSVDVLEVVIQALNFYREYWLSMKNQYPPDEAKQVWYQMIQLLPSSYNQKRTVELNYEVLAGIYKWRKDHKLDEWREFCRIMKDELPESWIFTGEE